MTKIVFDVDGVVLDFLPARQKLAKKYFPDREFEINDFHSDRIKTVFPNKDDLAKVYGPVYRITDPSKAPLFANVREIIPEIEKLGDLKFLSARCADVGATSRQLLKNHKLKLNVEYVDSPSEKIAKLADTNFYVDDSLKKLLEINTAHPKIALAWFDPTNLNQKIKFDSNNKIAIVKSWMEILVLIKSL